MPRRPSLPSDAVLTCHHPSALVRDRRVRDFYQRTRQQTKRESYFSLIQNCLSHSLGGEVRYLISSKIFDSVW